VNRHLTIWNGLTLSLVAALAGGAHAGASDAPAAARYFDYDRKAPLDLVVASSRAERGCIVHDVSYASPKGGRVPAYLVVPEGTGPFAGIIVQHGAPGSRDTALERAKGYARTGAVVLAISAPFARRNAGPRDMLRFDERDRDEQIQLVVDLMRGVDLLVARPDVDAKRIAYVGGSFGAAIGSLLAGVERRIKAYALWVGDGGPISHMRAMGERGPFGQGPDEELDRWVKIMDPIEPIRFVGRAAPAALLLQSARNDQYVPVTSAEAWREAASEPKTTKWYDAQHALNAEAFADQRTWLAGHVGIDPEKYSTDK
jgi:dienelactone hydrolase